MNIKTIGVVGAGAMGSGIAQVFAAHGFQVTLNDINDKLLQRALGTIEHSLERLCSKEIISARDKLDTVDNITTSSQLKALATVDLVVEAATEDMDIKLALFSQLDSLCKPQAVLASNTSSLSLTRIAAATARPERVIGMHFMNPVPLMKLVELIRALQTSDEVFLLVHELSKKLDKVPVEVKDNPGFVSNRLLMPMINEAIYTYSEGVASIEAIDDIMLLGMNHPIGPLALADLIGLDTCLSIMQVLHHGLGDDKYRPCPLLRRLVDAGYLGRKSSQGFYQYDARGKMIK